MKDFNKKKQEAATDTPAGERGQHQAVQIALKTWKIIFSCIKIALGAAATVGLVCAVCLFVFMNIVLDIIYKLLDPRVELD